MNWTTIKQTLQNFANWATPRAEAYLKFLWDNKLNSLVTLGLGLLLGVIFF